MQSLQVLYLVPLNEGFDNRRLNSGANYSGRASLRKSSTLPIRRARRAASASDEDVIGNGCLGQAMSRPQASSRSHPPKFCCKVTRNEELVMTEVWIVGVCRKEDACGRASLVGAGKQWAMAVSPGPGLVARSEQDRQSRQRICWPPRPHWLAWLSTH